MHYTLHKYYRIYLLRYRYPKFFIKTDKKTGILVFCGEGMRLKVFFFMTEVQG